MKKLIEQITHGEHPLVKEAFPRMDTSIFTGTPEKYIHLVTTDETLPKVVFIAIVERFNGKPPALCFNELLQIKRKYSFADCLILTTYYTLLTKAQFKKAFLKRLPLHDSALAHILESTNGYLMLPHQFEYIASMILRIPPAQAIELRRNFNKQRPDLYNGLDAGCVKVFKSIVRQYSVSGVLPSPSYYYAKNLYEYLHARKSTKR